MDVKSFFWLNKPKTYEIHEDQVTMTTEENTDYWQRTYYGFRNDNAHSFVRQMNEKEFSFLCKGSDESKNTF